jgi:hypothetical protein
MGGAARIAARRDLQDHRIRSRGQLGDDAEENLISLCAAVTEPNLSIAKNNKANRQRDATNRSWLAARIEQWSPKRRVGSSTLLRPTTLILSFSSSSTIPQIA